MNNDYPPSIVKKLFKTDIHYKTVTDKIHFATTLFAKERNYFIIIDFHSVTKIHLQPSLRQSL